MATILSSDDSLEEIQNTPAQSHEDPLEESIIPQGNHNNNKELKPNNKIRNSSNRKAFVIPEVLCTCLQRCTFRVTPQLIERVCTYFKRIKEKNRQYKYLASLMQRKCRAVQGDEKVRKMSFKYYVPILTDIDMQRQEQDETIALYAKLQGKMDPLLLEDYIDEFDGEFVEVCLKAFTTIHIISEKRVIITRATQDLKSEPKKTKPYLPRSIACDESSETSHEPQKKKMKVEEVRTKTLERLKQQMSHSGAEVSMLAGEWLARQAIEMQRNSDGAINPRTLLPEGLVLPASVTCSPVYATEPSLSTNYILQDHNRDMDIVNNFFTDQLWTPEYISEIP